MLNGIDVSNWQRGINIGAINCDFVIVKATQGTWYTSSEFHKQARQTLESGKKLGIYHYAEGKNYKSEADHFLKAVEPYLGKSVLCLDWESQDNANFGKQDLNWCKGWLNYVYDKTGVRPLLYCQQSIMARFAGVGDYGLWIAQYANTKPTGFQTAPWREGTYTCAIRQYSSTGRLSGYGGNLDLNKAYMNESDWDKYAESKLKPQKAEWRKNDVGWWYRYPDGSYPTNRWLLLDAWYWFNENGYAVTGWQVINNAWYHFGTDCRMTTGWLKDGEYWFYLNSNGDMRTGWLEYKGEWYWLSTEPFKPKLGAMLTSQWIQYKGNWYWINEKGIMLKNTEVKVEFDESGKAIPKGIDD